MKKKFTFLMAVCIMLLTMVLPWNAVGQEKSYTYELATSLSAGDEVVIVNTGLTKELIGVTTGSKPIGSCGDITGSAVSGIAGTYILTVEAGHETGKWSLKNSSNYLAYTWTAASGNNYLTTSTTKAANSSWTITFNESGQASIVNCSQTTRKLQFNSDRFCCYTSTQTAIKIYKRVEAQVATPTFSPAAGSYSSTQSVTISSTTGATIYYTTDGTTPTTSSSVYSSAISVSESMTIRAYATKSGLTDSDVATAEYNIVPSQQLYITTDHGTVAVTANDASVSITDGYYRIPQGANVTLTVTPSSGYIHTGWTVTEGSVIISNNSFTMPSSTVRLTANYEEVVVDNLTALLVNTAINNTTASYQSWTLNPNTAVYSGQSYNNNTNNLAYIQLRNSSPAGIVTTTSGGNAKKVSVTYSTVQTNTDGRYLTVYGKNTAYDGPADLYNSETRGTELGKITYNTNDTSDELIITGDYQYIGLLASGAMYFEPIKITWLPLTFYDVNYTASYTNSSSVEIGTVEVSKETAVAGETITITATGKNHYHFNGWTVLDGDAENVPLTGTNPATFTMPASDVKVDAAWEEDAKYTISVADGSGDYVLSPENSYAAETVLVQIADVPDGKFIDEVTVAKNGGGNVDDVTYTGQEGDYYKYTFTMPAEAVTVSVTFKDPETYTVSYYVKGTLDKSEDYTEGTSVTLPTATTTVDITGFTLLGWSETESSTTTLPAGAYYPSGDVDLYAVLGVVSNTSLTITKDTKNFPDSYGTANTFTEYTLEGKKFKIQQGYVNGTKLQWRASGNSNGTGTMYNNENFGKITSIILVYDESDSNKNFTVKAGTSANPTSGTSITGTTTGNVVTFDLSGSSYTHFVLTNGTGAGYLSSITINYEESATVSTVTEYTANNASRSLDIEASECVIVKSTGILTFTGSNKGNAANIIVENGGQLKVSSSGVQATFKKTISQSTKGSAWNTISSPVGSVGITSVTNLVNGTGLEYNLYRYNETVASSQWEAYNPNNHADFTTLEKGRGYLYRNNGKEIAFAGEVNTTSASVTLTASETALPQLKGFNLIGNPFGQDITMSNISGAELSGGYVLSNDGGWNPDVETTIHPCQGFLVQVSEETNITINKPASKGTTYNKEYIKFIVANGQYEDATFALFEQGYGLNKINHRNADIPMLYINKDNRDLAIATMSDDIKSFNLNFKAMTMGQYTLSYKATGEYSYLHVIDRLTGANVDMLIEGNYTFVATPNDNENRFIVQLAYKPDYSEGNNDIFAYQTGSEILVSGSGELQIFDVTGRMIMNTNINGAEAINVTAQGVYILRLVGTEVKTQKIVVR